MALGYLDPDAVHWMIAGEAGLTVVDLQDLIPIEPAATARVSRELAERHRVVAVGFDEDVLIVASDAPLSDLAMSELETVAGCLVEQTIAPTRQISVALSRQYRIWQPPPER